MPCARHAVQGNRRIKVLCPHKVGADREIAYSVPKCIHRIIRQQKGFATEDPVADPLAIDASISVWPLRVANDLYAMQLTPPIGPARSHSSQVLPISRVSVANSIDIAYFTQSSHQVSHTDFRPTIGHKGDRRRHEQNARSRHGALFRLL